MHDNEETLELYRIMVETAGANELRRQQINSVFITLLAAGVGIAGSIPEFETIYLSVAAVIISTIWWLQITFLKRLAKAKFHVIFKLEEKFSFQPFREEWEFLNNGRINLWKQKHLFNFSLSAIERMVPSLIFITSVSYTMIKFLGII